MKEELLHVRCSVQSWDLALDACPHVFSGSGGTFDGHHTVTVAAGHGKRKMHGTQRRFKGNMVETEVRRGQCVSV